MGSVRVEQFSEKECTPRCHSQQHAELILNAITKGSAAEIRAFSNWLCHNFTSVTDVWGRNILHIAASCGKWEVIEWLLDHCHCDVDVRDAESGWSALHRSFFYGQLGAAQALLNHGASIRMIDHEGLTPLDLIIADRLPYIEYQKTYPQDVYVWGSNNNYNLGLGNEQSRSYAEGVEFFRKKNINIHQVVICKFHTVFLTNDGKLFTCGHGHGGRLGRGSEVTGLTPSPVHGVSNTQCLQIAAGQDHLILLMTGGQVWTCGLNTYHQLGHNPPSERLVSPRSISLKFLKGKQIVGVCAARFHSVFYTRDSIFTFGLNAGQLGHPKGERTQIIPRQVSGVYHKEWLITEVIASDGATVCATNQGDVYVLHEFQHRKIASKQIGIQKLAVIGGHLDSSCDAAGIREGGGLELRVMILTRTGKLYLWRQTNPFLRRCLFTSSLQLVISDIHLNHYSVAMVTEKNQCYVGSILPFRGKKINTGPSSPPITPKSPGLNFLLDREECYSIRAKRLPYLHRATSITSDSKGRNFAVLQASPKMGLLEFPIVSECKLQNDMLTFLEETNIDDSFHDVIINVGQRQYAAHKYILASGSEYFRKRLVNPSVFSCKEATLDVDNVKPEDFEQILKFIYCNTCNFLTEGFEVKWKNSVGNDFPINCVQNKDCAKDKQKKKNVKMAKHNEDSNNPIKCVQEASRRFSLHPLTKMLENVKLVNGKILAKSVNQLPRLRFDRQKLTEFCDIRLLSEDGVEFLCHKCILAARSDYFHSMLGSCWLEETRLGSLSLPISSRIMEIILHYLYTDVESYINTLDDPEFLCHILAVADQLLMMRLKEMCEATLVGLVTLKNVCELLQLALIYNAIQLKNCCMEYICINLPAVVEARSLDVLSNGAIKELSRMYRCMVSSMRRRVITASGNEPNGELLREVEKCYPIQEDCDIIKHKVDIYKPENKSKGRRRTNSQRADAKEPNQDIKPRHSFESSEKEFSMDIEAVLEKNKISPIKVSPHESNTENKLIAKKPSRLIMCCPILSEWPSLKNIGTEEKQPFTVLQKSNSSHTESRRVNHISQKQKKLLAAANKDSELQSPKLIENDCAKSPPACAWGKTVEQPASPSSFWDAVGKGGLQSSLTKSCGSESPSTENYSSMSPIHKEQSEPFILSLEEIQRAEEKEQQYKFITAKVKSLQLINIEDQAIEELLKLYKAKDNPRERVCVSRILPERIANPVWKKRA